MTKGSLLVWTLRWLAVVVALVFAGWSAALLRQADHERRQVAQGARLTGQLEALENATRGLERAIRSANHLALENVDSIWARAFHDYRQGLERIEADSPWFPQIGRSLESADQDVARMGELYRDAAAFRLGDPTKRSQEEEFVHAAALAADAIREAGGTVRGQMGLLSLSLDTRWRHLRTLVMVSCLLALCLGIMLLIHQRDLDRRRRVEAELRGALEFSADIEKLGHAINGNTEIDAILDLVCQAVVRHCGIPHASIIYRSPSTHELTESVTTVPEQKAAGLTIHKEVRPQGGRTQHILATRERIVMENMADDPFVPSREHLSDRFGMRSYVGMPVEAGGEVLGVMYAMAREPRRYEAKVLLRLEQLATQAGAALSNAHLFWEARRQTLNLEETVRQRTRDLEQANVELRNEITERQRTKEELESSLSILRGTLESTADGIMVADKNGEVVTFNRKFLDMWQLSRELVEGQGHHAGMEVAKDRLADPETFVRRVQELYENPEKEAWDTLVFADGRIIERYSLPQRSGGQIVGRVWSFRDITQRRRAEDRLAFLAYHDSLTGLPNKTAFVEHLEKALRASQGDEGGDFAVLFLDLDRFKLINDAMGHIVGDKLLIAVSRRLEHCARSGLDMVARFGGDEYTFFLEGVRDSVQVGQRADEILEVLSEPLDLEGHEIYPTACIGIALASMRHDSVEEILRDADTAMYRAKSLGKNRYAIFDRRMHAHLLQMLAVETELRRAISGGELRTYYQPIVDLEEKRIAGFEALVRWEHPERGVIPPMDFIPMAEETGLVIEIGEWVLSEASRQLGSWHKRLDGRPLPYVTVNISGVHFMQSNLLDVIERSLEESRIPPNFLRIEITESVFMGSAEWSTDMIGRLKAMDLKILIDDFGTGYSSLNYLHRFPIDALKIDRSFISSLGQDNDAYEIVLAISTLAKALGMDVIAEGVETQEQMQIVRELGIRYVQGFLISKAVPMAEAEALLENLPALG